MRKR
jgi:hypothetical protein